MQPNVRKSTANGAAPGHPIRFFILIALMFAFQSTAGIARAQESGADTEAKLLHYKPTGGVHAEIEVHFPKGHLESGRKVPGVILFHGGSWRGGSRNQFKQLAAYLAGRGLVAATAKYSLATQEEFDNQKNPSAKRVCITDAKSAIRWFKKNANELGIDPDRIIAGGGSAGGHVALLATTNPGLNHPDDPADLDTSVVAYLLFNPALHTRYDSQDPEVFLEKHLKKNMPPMIAFWGENDAWMAGWKTAHATMKSMGIDNVEWWLAHGEGHSFFLKDPWKSLTFRKTDEFLVKLGLLEGESSMPVPAGGAELVPVF